MVWTAIIGKPAKNRNCTKSVIFESSHDSKDAYDDFLSRCTGKFDKDYEVIVLIPGKHTFMYFPDRS